MGVNPPTAEDRRRFDEFYRRKWQGHRGLWSERYPPEQIVYATTVYGRRNEAIAHAAGRGRRALDVGCGVGDVASLLASRGFAVQGVDVSEENARRARDNLRDAASSAGVALAQAEDLPFRDDAFDVVVIADVIEHVGSVDRSLREIARVLRPGGRMICVTPIRRTLAGLRFADGVARRITALARGKAFDHVAPAVHERFLSTHELRRALVAAGLRPVGFRRICFYPAPETVGAFGALMAHRFRRSPDRFPRTAERAIRVFDAIARLRVLNQKQLWVAVR